MRKLAFIVAILFSGIFRLFAQPSDIDEPTSIQRIMVEAAEYVIQAENELNLEIVHLEFDLILQNDWKYMFRNLSSSWNYIIYTAGETGQVLDMDLKVLVLNEYTNEYDAVDEDVTYDRDAAIIVSPSKSAKYAIGVKAAEYSAGYSGSHYFILIAHEKP